MEYLTKQQPEMVILRKAIDDAAQEGIPLIGDVLQQRHGPALMVVMHYDYADDLSLSEKILINKIVKRAARKMDREAEYTLRDLQYTLQPKTVNETAYTQQAQEETDRAIKRYMETCRARTAKITPFGGT